MKKEHVKLSTADFDYLTELLSKGVLPTSTYKRAQALLDLHKGNTYVAVAELVGRNYVTISTWAKKYKADGLKFLHDLPRSGRPSEITGEQRAKITALACSEPPSGYARWSLRLLADKVVELGICPHLSHNEAGKILKKRTSTS